MKVGLKIECRMVKESLNSLMDLRLRVFLRITNYMGLLHKLIQQDFIKRKENTFKVKKMVFKKNILMIN
jgi:hypothetical protein